MRSFYPGIRHFFIPMVLFKGHSNVVIHADQKNKPYFVPRKSIDFKMHS
ncbi:hypothetical protein Golob_013449 [Gossypium lobatum]|uniref:Uncharacterized protein n=1 Tax=Gossypium lobatum TaxID=34289 RepID=A0A7J8LPI4_9ROSI|nr:hypothetical protein [Gossypium lobatum]